MGEYYTKSELGKRWSKRLIEDYFPICSEEKVNPHYRCGSPMQLYDIEKVRRIESTDAFKADYAKVLKRKVAALERAKKKRQELMTYANGVQIEIPTMEKDKLIEKACYHYNSWKEWKEGGWDGEWRATPSCDESFLKRITVNYLRHECTCYDKELQKFIKKIGKNEAHDVLQKRINEAIIQKYEWLR
jgi:hypothetical protein